MKKKNLIWSVGLAMTTTAVVFTACTKKSSSSDTSTSALSVSGGFSSLSLLSQDSSVGLMAATDYTMVCSMLVSPYSSDAEALGADGSFALSIAGGQGAPIGCFLTKAGAVAGVFEFQTSGSDSGSALPVNSGTTSIQLPTTLTLGTDGTVAVPVANITQNSSTAPSVTFADPTGTWTISKACKNELDDATGKTKATCMSPSQTNGQIPSSVYMQKVTATNASTSDVKTGLALWRSAAARTACGNVEGIVDLPSGYAADGGWAAAFTGGQDVDLSTTTKVNTALPYAKASIWQGQTTCGETATSSGGALQEGTTLCSDLDFSSNNWGMNAAACKLHCVLNAMNRGESDNGTSYFDWASYKGSAVSCSKRYRMNWHFQNEFQTDADFGGSSNPTGVLSDGKCDRDANGSTAGVGDGCFETINGSPVAILEADERGPSDRFMFGVFNVVGNVGTLIQKENTGKHNFDNGGGTPISCGGTHMEKLTMIQTSATQAQVTVEHSFVPDTNNDAGCASNSDFAEMKERDDSFTLQLSK